MASGTTTFRAGRMQRYIPGAFFGLFGMIYAGIGFNVGGGFLVVYGIVGGFFIIFGLRVIRSGRLLLSDTSLVAYGEFRTYRFALVDLLGAEVGEGPVGFYQRRYLVLRPKDRDPFRVASFNAGLDPDGVVDRAVAEINLRIAGSST